MTIASRNCRGAGSKAFPSTIKEVVSSHHINVLCLLEHRISVDRANRAIRSLVLIVGLELRPLALLKKFGSFRMMILPRLITSVPQPNFFTANFVT